MVMLENLHDTVTIGLIGDRIVQRTLFSDESTGFSWYVIDSMDLEF